MAETPGPEPRPDDAHSGPPADARPVTISFPVSEPLHYALKTRALQERTTVKAVVMRALKAIGLDVPEEELSDRRTGRAGRPKGRP